MGQLALRGPNAIHQTKKGPGLFFVFGVFGGENKLSTWTFFSGFMPPEPAKESQLCVFSCFRRQIVSFHGVWEFHLIFFFGSEIFGSVPLQRAEKNFRVENQMVACDFVFMEPRVSTSSGVNLFRAWVARFWVGGL